MLFPTSLVGSYPQPDWLIDRARLAGRFPPRVRARELWRVDPAYLQARAEQAHRYGVKAVNRALEGAAGTTAVHLCFGYAAIIHDRPAGYSFLPELADCSCDQISIETAQSGLDCSVLAALDGKTIILGVLDLNDLTVESPETVMARVRRLFRAGHPCTFRVKLPPSRI